MNNIDKQYWLNVAKNACIGVLAAPILMLGVALVEVGICAMVAVAIKCALYFVGAM